jgi:hypothetical protein
VAQFQLCEGSSQLQQHLLVSNLHWASELPP